MTVNENTHVTVCACTYQRLDGLRKLLEGLVQQTFTRIPPPIITIIIADNEGNSQVKAMCAEFRQRYSIPLTYIHEPRRGVSYARNACLNNAPANTDFFAMIDDDEIPAPDWLEQLLLVQAETNADVVHGPTLPIFDVSVPAWIVRCGYFEKPPPPSTLVDRQPITVAATCNVLFRSSMIRNLKIQFDEPLAISGGEDALFFGQIKDAGYQLVWAAHAQVWETIPPSRACLSYMLRASFGSGNRRLFRRLRRHAINSLWKRTRLTVLIFFESLKAVVSGIIGLWGLVLPGPSTKERSALRAFKIAFGLGMLLSIFGFKYEKYKPA
jgi:glycosyltransferase involved in cell wall biosynthesis